MKGLLWGSIRIPDRDLKFGCSFGSIVANEGCNMGLDVAKDSWPWCPCMAGWAKGRASKLTVGTESRRNLSLSGRLSTTSYH